jgi:hypothetical protein
MKNNTPQPAARGKTFAVAPMMDGKDRSDKSISYQASCALCVQQGRAGCVKCEAVFAIIDQIQFKFACP